jgi:hypothetical protein
MDCSHISMTCNVQHVAMCGRRQCPELVIQKQNWHDSNPWCRACPEKVTVTQLVKKFPQGPLQCSQVSHRILFRTNWNRTSPILRSSLLITAHLHHYVSTGLASTFLSSTPMHATLPANSWQFWVEVTNYKVPLYVTFTHPSYSFLVFRFIASHQFKSTSKVQFNTHQSLSF